jgi:hypothetical protein
MTLRKIENASVIHSKQFRTWRNTGVAFEFGDQSYTEPNRSLAAYTEAHKKNHGSVLCRGLWTDIVVGPYVSFGVQCDAPNKLAKQLFEVHNKGTGVEQNRHVGDLSACPLLLNVRGFTDLVGYRTRQRSRCTTCCPICMRWRRAMSTK